MDMGVSDGLEEQEIIQNVNYYHHYSKIIIIIIIPECRLFAAKTYLKM